MSLNEIVNAPTKYLSCHPYLVVQHVDWIQCRYLLVQSAAADDAVTGQNRLDRSSAYGKEKDKSRYDALSILNTYQICLHPATGLFDFSLRFYLPNFMSSYFLAGRTLLRQLKLNRIQHAWLFPQ